MQKIKALKFYNMKTAYHIVPFKHPRSITLGALHSQKGGGSV